jgi:glycosyltransferase involved in cell wall biosynthesis
MSLKDYNPLVSVVIPVYKGAAYVGQAIESVLAQTYRNIEIIVVDDGSPDDGATRRAVEAYLPRVRYIYQENGGVAAALNTGARNMRGEIFSWLSHDDLFVPDKTEKQIEFIRQLGRKDAVLYSDYMIVDPDNNRMYDVVMDHEMLTRQPLLAVLRGATNGCTMLLPREVFQTIGYFDERLRFTQDYDFWDRIEDTFPLVHCPGIMVRQRVHPGQDSNKPESVIECNRLWLNLSDGRNDLKKSLIAGSPLCFLRGLLGFVSQTPYEGAIKGLEERIESAIPDTLVTLVVDLPPNSTSLSRAVGSFINQTHAKIEMIIIDRSGDSAWAMIDRLAGRFTRVEHINAAGLGAAAGRNLAIDLARGAYVVFASADDVFTPNRILAQMSAMQQSGAQISHASFFLSCPERATGYAMIASATFQGQVYPKILERCPVWLSTAMFNRLVFIQGARFAGDGSDENARFFIELARRHVLLGVDDVGVMVEMRASDAPLSLETTIEALGRLRMALDCDPTIDLDSPERQALESRYRRLATAIRLLKAAGQVGPLFNQELFDTIFVNPSIDIDFDAHGLF